MEKDDDYIPLSARGKFKLSALKTVEESNEFKTLQEECDEINKEDQKKKKALIIKCAKLERQDLLKQAF